MWPQIIRIPDEGLRKPENSGIVLYKITKIETILDTNIYCFMMHENENLKFNYRYSQFILRKSTFIMTVKEQTNLVP
jgi:hypothetical protein